jgi:hypothetical protein
MWLKGQVMDITTILFYLLAHVVRESSVTVKNPSRDDDELENRLFDCMYVRMYAYIL